MSNPVPDPSLGFQGFVIWVVPFMAYLVGIIIRKVALPGKESPPLAHQLLLGVPVSLVIVSPTLAILRATVGQDIGTYLFTLGIIMEHGMLVQEEATKHLKRLRRLPASSQRPPNPVGRVDG
jgi:hypothetical protein